MKKRELQVGDLVVDGASQEEAIFYGIGLVVGIFCEDFELRARSSQGIPAGHWVAEVYWFKMGSIEEEFATDLAKLETLNET